MKIEDVIAKGKHSFNNLPPLQKKVLKFIQQHGDEVFPYGDIGIQEGLPGVKTSAIDWSLWALNGQGFLAKTKVGRRVYFGLPTAIERLNDELKKKPGKK